MIEPAGGEGRFGGHSMYGRLRRVLVRPPDESFAEADPEAWHYTRRPDLARARDQHAHLVGLLERAGVEVIVHDATLSGMADSVFVYDPVWITDGGTVVLASGKPSRRGEEEPLACRLEAAGVPILGRLEGRERAEGGDLLWLDPSTVIAGRSFRTNDAGIAALGRILEPLGVRVLAVDLPYLDGPRACLHLLTLLSLVDHRCAVVYPRFLPVRLWQLLEERGFDLVEVPEEELPTQGPNVLALAPGHCVAIEGNPITRRRLEAAGCRVETYPASDISLVAEGGPTCLTRPVLRDPVPEL
ncbi:MAG: arginine deiminase family protein [Holophagales bacterium]|nr:arginine deiminase family protein [Holophagales bacterium]